MVQVIRAVDRGPSAGEKWGQAVGEALKSGIQLYGQYKKGQEEKANREQDNLYYRELTGHDLPNDPKLRGKAFELALLGKTSSQMEAKESKLNKEMISFADKLEMNNPQNPMYKTIADIYRSGMPSEEKSNIVKSLTGIDPFKVQQQQRLQLDSVLKRYTQRIKEIDDEISNVRNPNSTGREEADELKRQRNALRAERDQLLDFKALNGMEDEEDSFEKGFENETENEEERSKVNFDSNNKKHRAVAEKLFKQYKDKEKVRQILRKSFKGV